MLARLRTGCFTTALLTVLWGHQAGQCQDAATGPAATTWAASYAPGSKVSYRGQNNLDGAGSQQGNIMYPGGAGLIGFFAAIAVHGAMTSSSRDAEKERLQAKANEVLAPYQAVLQAFTDEALLQRSVAASTFGKGQVAGQGGSDPPNWSVESRPVFSMTQDQSAFILDNQLSVRLHGSGAGALYEGTVRVVSQHVKQDPIANHWVAQDGENLRQVLGSLLASSLDMALQQAAGLTPSNASTTKSVRYNEGRNTRVERAYVLQAECERWVIKTLRGWLMSVPVSAGAEGQNCSVSGS